MRVFDVCWYDRLCRHMHNVDSWMKQCLCACMCTCAEAWSLHSQCSETIDGMFSQPHDGVVHACILLQWVCIDLYVCVCLVLYVWILWFYLHTYLCVHACITRTCQNICMHGIHMHTYTCVCVFRMSSWHKCVCMGICACMCLDAPLMYVWKQLISLLLRCATWFVCTYMRMHVGMYACRHVCADVSACVLIDGCSHFTLCAHVACTAHVHVTNE
jgi:hypothetical protein